jgi:hypothetical protein
MVSSSVSCHIQKITLIIAFWLFSLASYSQFKYGISGGINLTYLKLDWNQFENPESIPRFGFSFGLGGELHIQQNLYLMGDVNLLSKNYALDVEDFYGDGTEGYDRYSILYLDIPIKLAYSYKDIRFFSGPFIDFCLGGTNQHDLQFFDGENDKATNDIDSRSPVKSDEESMNIFPLENHYFLDSGFIIGIGHQHDNFAIDLSYSIGMLNIFPLIEGEDSRSNYPMYTRVLSIDLFFYL